MSAIEHQSLANNLNTQNKVEKLLDLNLDKNLKDELQNSNINYNKINEELKFSNNKNSAEFQEAKEQLQQAIETVEAHIKQKEYLVQLVAPHKKASEQLVHTIRELQKEPEPSAETKASLQSKQAELHTVISSHLEAMPDKIPEHLVQDATKIIFGEWVHYEVTDARSGLEVAKTAVKNDDLEVAATVLKDTVENHGQNTAQILQEAFNANPKKTWLRQEVIQLQKTALKRKTEDARLQQTYGSPVVTSNTLANTTLQNLTSNNQTNEVLQMVQANNGVEVQGNNVILHLDPDNKLTIAPDNTMYLGTVLVRNLQATSLDEARLQNTLERKNANTLFEQNAIFTKEVIKQLLGVDFEDANHTEADDQLLIKALIDALPLKGGAAEAKGQLEALGLVQEGSTTIIEHRAKKLRNFLRATTGFEPQALKHVPFSTMQAYMAQVIAAESTTQFNPEILSIDQDLKRTKDLENFFDGQNTQMIA